MFARVLGLFVLLVFITACNPVVLPEAVTTGGDERYDFFIRFPWNGTVQMNGYKEVLASPNCKTVATIGHTLNLYDIREGYGTFSGGTLSYEGNWSSLSFSPDGSKLVAVNNGQTPNAEVIVFDLETQSSKPLVTGQQGWVSIQLATWSDGNVELTVDAGGLRQFTVDMNSEVRELPKIPELAEFTPKLFQTCEVEN